MNEFNIEFARICRQFYTNRSSEKQNCAELTLMCVSLRHVHTPTHCETLPLRVLCSNLSLEIFAIHLSHVTTPIFHAVIVVKTLSEAALYWIVADPL